MTFFSLVLTPNDVNSCVNMFRQHSETLCPKCGINKTITVKKTLRLTMAVIDIDYGAFIRRPMDWTFEYETPQFVLNNRFKFTLKIKPSTSDQEIIVCHLHEVRKIPSR
ncbi:PREDICTED: uncharacterized protein LOC107166011 [Diuraphis noxia]|uniref:uncharacterized protein LOC107166011 n=1 Tax=Diuraphis noxia TaxID=143948 RepID=UPI0007639021|nr:PREDICTED: uncharacterized protein LOC107166011 [Diuraphis noxia]